MRHGLALAAVLVVLPLGTAVAQAADPHAAQPERPSVATHAHTVAPGWAEVELGFARGELDDPFGYEALPLELKLGLKPRWQLTLATAVARAAGKGSTSVGAVGAGIKWRIAEHVPVAGDVALMPTLTMPVDSDDAAAGSLLVIASRTLGTLTLDLNASYTRRGGDGTKAPKDESLWAAAFGGPLGGRFGWVGELSGSPSSSGPAGRARTINSLVGATANLRSSLVVDVAVSMPIAGPDSSAILTGVVWNVGRLWAGRSRVP